LLVDEAAPPGPLEAAEPPPIPPLLDAAPPLVPPVAPALPESVLELAPAPGVLGVVLEDEDDEPPGTTMVSRFSLVEDDAEPLGLAEPPGTTVVVSLRSHAESANAPTANTIKLPRFISTLLSS
jgi:hypothetical protein